MQFKTIVNPSFVITQLELEEHIRDGWRIDQDNLPVDNMMYFEISLVRDEHREAVKAVFKEDSTTIDFNIAKLPEQSVKRGRKPTQ